MYIIKQSVTGLMLAIPEHKKSHTNSIMLARAFYSYDNACDHCKDDEYVLELESMLHIQ